MVRVVVQWQGDIAADQRCVCTVRQRHGRRFERRGSWLLMFFFLRRHSELEMDAPMGYRSECECVD